jgi:5-methylcytosine-specific restriction endonuclease McrA
MSKKSYPNHSLMKKNRLIKLKQTKCKCEVCGGKASVIHHLDGSMDNHKLENLSTLCPKCHVIIHTHCQIKMFQEITLPTDVEGKKAKVKRG